MEFCHHSRAIRVLATAKVICPLGEKCLIDVLVDRSNAIAFPGPSAKVFFLRSSLNRLRAKQPGLIWAVRLTNTKSLVVAVGTAVG
jgi:hypothetical protein